jgi:hypothetical protein
MKADEARRIRRAHEAARENRARGLEEFLRTGERTDRVVPELIPDSVALSVATREVRRLVRVAERTPRGKRARKLDELCAAMRWLIYVERVMALDPLERAALTPAALSELGRVSRDDVVALYDRMRGASNVEVAS